MLTELFFVQLVDAQLLDFEFALLLLPLQLQLGLAPAQISFELRPHHGLVLLKLNLSLLLEPCLLAAHDLVLFAFVMMKRACGLALQVIFVARQLRRGTVSNFT